MASIERFDHLRKELEYWRAKAVAQVRRYRNSLRVLRRSAFEIGSLIVRARRDWHNELLDLAREDGFAKLDEWIEDKLSIVDVLNEDRQRFLANINKGMTLKQYLAKGGSWGIDPNPQERERQTDSVINKKPMRMTEAEQVCYYRTVVAAMRSELVELRKENATLRREVAILEKFRKHLERI